MNYKGQVYETNNNLYVHQKSCRETWSPKVNEVRCHSLLTGGDGGRRRPYVVSYYCNCNLGTKSRSLCHADREIVCRGCRVLPYKMLYMIMMYKIQTHAALPCQVCFRVEVSCWETSPHESDQLIPETFCAYLDLGAKN